MILTVCSPPHLPCGLGLDCFASMLLMYSIFRNTSNTHFPIISLVFCPTHILTARHPGARTCVRPVCDVQFRSEAATTLPARYPCLEHCHDDSNTLTDSVARRTPPAQSRPTRPIATRSRSPARCAVSVRLPVSTSPLCNLLFTDGGTAPTRATLFGCYIATRPRVPS